MNVYLGKITNAGEGRERRGQKNTLRVYRSAAKHTDKQSGYLIQYHSK